MLLLMWMVWVASGIDDDSIKGTSCKLPQLYVTSDKFVNVEFEGKNWWSIVEFGVLPTVLVTTVWIRFYKKRLIFINKRRPKLSNFTSNDITSMKGPSSFRDSWQIN